VVSGRDRHSYGTLVKDQFMRPLLADCHPRQVVDATVNHLNDEALSRRMKRNQDREEKSTQKLRVANLRSTLKETKRLKRRAKAFPSNPKRRFCALHQNGHNHLPKPPSILRFKKF
jgi:hypothetical protein